MSISALVQKQPFKLPFSKGFLLWMGFLGVLLAIGVYSAVTVFIQGLYITNMSDSVPWGLWITIDLSSIALGAGAFTLSAVVYIFGIKRLQPIIRLAVLVGFAGYTSAMLTLLMDIGRPDRFWHPWVFWNVHSVLWEVTMCVTVYLMILVTEFAPVIVETKFFDKWPKLRQLGNFLHKFNPVPCCTRSVDLTSASIFLGRHVWYPQVASDLVQAQHAHHVRAIRYRSRTRCHSGSCLRSGMDHRQTHDPA